MLHAPIRHFSESCRVAYIRRLGEREKKTLTARAGNF